MGLFDRLRRSAPAAPPPPRARKVTKIQRAALDLICEASKSSHPDEFIAALRAEGDTVTEIVIIPAIQGRAHALPIGIAMPQERSLVGTIHSHPNGVTLPSDADRMFFRHYGHTHIIMGAPYNPRSWRAWDHDARPIELQVV